MGVWIGALLTYTIAFAPRVGRLFVLGQAAAGIGQIADEAFGALYRLREGGIVVAREDGGAADQGKPCPTCGQSVR